MLTILAFSVNKLQRNLSPENELCFIICVVECIKCEHICGPTVNLTSNHYSIISSASILEFLLYQKTFLNAYLFLDFVKIKYTYRCEIHKNLN